MRNTDIDVAKAAQILKLLGDKTRLTIISVLQKRECCVCELVELFDMSQPSISQHLRKIKDAGLVTEERKGQWIYYSLDQSSEYYLFVTEILQHVDVQNEKILLMDNSNLKSKYCC